MEKGQNVSFDFNGSVLTGSIIRIHKSAVSEEFNLYYIDTGVVSGFIRSKGITTPVNYKIVFKSDIINATN